MSHQENPPVVQSSRDVAESATPTAKPNRDLEAEHSIVSTSIGNTMTDKFQELGLEGSHDGVAIERKAAGKRPRTSTNPTPHVSRSATEDSFFAHPDIEDDSGSQVNEFAEGSGTQSGRAASALDDPNIPPPTNTPPGNTGTQTEAVATPTTATTNATVEGIDGRWIRIYDVDGGVKVIKSIKQVPGEEVIVYDKSRDGPDRVRVLSKLDNSIDREY